MKKFILLTLSILLALSNPISFADQPNWTEKASISESKIKAYINDQYIESWLINDLVYEYH